MRFPGYKLFKVSRLFILEGEGMKNLVAIMLVMTLAGCITRPAATSTTDDSANIGGGVRDLPDQIIDGDIPGCVDAIELINQQIVLPDQNITFDVGNVIDRIGVVVEGATYSYSTRVVNPVGCSSTNLPEIPMPTISFGFNYLGDFSRFTTLCMNASTIEFTDFSMSETPLDLLIEGSVNENIWFEVDRSIASVLHSLLIGGPYPDTANPRCGNWVDLLTL